MYKRPVIGFFEDQVSTFWKSLGFLKPLCFYPFEGLSLVEKLAENTESKKLALFMRPTLKDVFLKIYSKTVLKWLIGETYLSEILVNPLNLQEDLILLNSRLRVSATEKILNVLEDTRGNNILLTPRLDIVALRVGKNISRYLTRFLQGRIHIELLLPFRDLLVEEIVPDEDVLLDEKNLNIPYTFQKNVEQLTIKGKHVETVGKFSIKGRVLLREKCIIKDSVIENSTIGYGSSIENSVIKDSIIGDYVEIKDSVLEKTIVGDFSFINRCVFSRPRISVRGLLPSYGSINIVGEACEVESSKMYYIHLVATESVGNLRGVYCPSSKVKVSLLHLERRLKAMGADVSIRNLTRIFRL